MALQVRICSGYVLVGPSGIVPDFRAVDSAEAEVCPQS